MKRMKLFNEDNLIALKKLPDNSIDSVVTDPPYGLSFMNKKWDYDVPKVDFWKEVFRVLKPGGHVLSFGGTRTYHRMVVNMEDAGFEIRDQIMWIYGSGFPKSLNVGKAVDKLNGVEREIFEDPRWIDKYPNGNNKCLEKSEKVSQAVRSDSPLMTSKGSSEFEGFGTALKPANEPICLARKPLSEKSVAENVLKWKTGGLNIDGCRVGYRNDDDKKSAVPGGKISYTSESWGQQSGLVKDLQEKREANDEGRFPANIILECCCDEVIEGEKGEKIERNKNITFNNFGKRVMGDSYTDKGNIHTNPDCPCYIMDQQSGENKRVEKNATGEMFGTGKITNHNDKGGASRFFYQAKVSKAERNMGLDGFEEKDNIIYMNNTIESSFKTGSGNLRNTQMKNNHPTVKPINLLTYLCRLVTPPKGIVLDPFMGSGSTGIAAQLEGFRFVGMELDEDYFKIAEARIENFESYKKFIK